MEGNDLRLSFSWTAPRSLLEKPPMTAAPSNRIERNNDLGSLPYVGNGNAELNAVITPGDSKLPCYQMYEELETLKGFAAGLNGQGILLM